MTLQEYRDKLAAMYPDRRYAEAECRCRRHRGDMPETEYRMYVSDSDTGDERQQGLGSTPKQAMRALIDAIAMASRAYETPMECVIEPGEERLQDEHDAGYDRLAADLET